MEKQKTIHPMALILNVLNDNKLHFWMDKPGIINLHNKYKDHITLVYDETRKVFIYETEKYYETNCSILRIIELITR